jgi:hypothetical protein
MKDLAQLAREAAYKAYGEGQSINGIAEAVLQLVVEHAPDNHHNALTCAYCLPLEELRVALRDLDAATIVRAIAMYRDMTRPVCSARHDDGFVCTLDPGHVGDHDASGCQTWPNQPNSAGALAGDGSSTT